MIGLTGHACQAWQVQSDMLPVQSKQRHQSRFNLHTFGFQVRYRYQLTPLSNLCVVYSRSGYDQGELFTNAPGECHRAFNLRDTEQLMIKLAYRFEA